MIRGYHGSIDDIIQTDLAILPIGSIEQHGHHLPVSTDWIIADALGRGLAERTGGFYITALPISTNKEQIGKRGSVGMASDTFYRMVSDICVDLKAQGFKKVAILQCHGGIFAMTPIVRELNAAHNPDLFVAKLDPIDLCWPRFKPTGILETDNELHAGEGETSLLLHLCPERVDMDKAVDFVPDVPRGDLNYGGILRYCPDGVWGEATKGTAEKGEKMLAFMIDVMSAEMDRIFGMMEQKRPMEGRWF